MTNELIKKLLEAGVHFGHQTKRWNPKMKRFIFGERSKIYIIDLEKTADNLNKACDFAHDVAAQGGTVLFVGTKKQAQDVVEEESKRCEMFHVRARWLGGLLTNFKTVRKSIDRLNEIEHMQEEGIFTNLTKKEVAALEKERERLLRDLSGIREMGNLPQAVIIIDSKKEDIAVKEARRLKIPIIGLIDTNCDPDMIDYPVPGNDDALKSIRFIVSQLTDSIISGRKKYLASSAKIKKAAASEEDNKVMPADIESIEDSVESDDEEKREPRKVKLEKEDA